MICRGKILDGESGGRSQAVSYHQNLVMDLIVQLYLSLWVVLRIFLEEFHFVAIDPTIIIDVIKEHLNAARQRVPNRGRHGAGVGREYSQGDGLIRYIYTGTSFETTPTTVVSPAAVAASVHHHTDDH